MNEPNLTQNPTNGTAAVAAGTAAVAAGSAYASSPLERASMKHGGRKKAAWGDWAGATYTSLGNLGASGINALGNMYSAKQLGQAYSDAANILTEGYKQLKGIDMDALQQSDFAAPHTMAVVRGANTNINPQLERIRRTSNAETRAINRGTISSAARQQRLAATNDRMRQAMSEQYAYKHNADEQIKQQNAQAITQTAQANADRDVQARKNYANQRLALLKYNADIENSKIMGIAQANSDAIMNTSQANANAYQQSMSGFGQALANSGQAFGASAAAIQKRNDEMKINIFTSPTAESQLRAYYATGNTYGATTESLQSLYDTVSKTNPDLANAFADMFGLKKTVRAKADYNTRNALRPNIGSISNIPTLNLIPTF